MTQKAKIVKKIQLAQLRMPESPAYRIGEGNLLPAHFWQGGLISRPSSVQDEANRSPRPAADRSNRMEPVRSKNHQRTR
jgi:hypothetical protein